MVRTDAGVSALAQMVQFDAVTPKSPLELKSAFNIHLPKDIRVLEINVVDPKFSAMATLWKRYVYRIKDEDCARTLSHGEGLDQQRVTGTLTSEGVAQMQKAANHLVGKHDFAAFQSKGGRTSTVRTIFKVEVCRQDDVTKVIMEGDGFLYHQCRILAGTLLQVGHGLRDVESCKTALESRDRATCGPTLPADGLCLEHVEYTRPHPAAAGPA